MESIQRTYPAAQRGLLRLRLVFGLVFGLLHGLRHLGLGGSGSLGSGSGSAQVLRRKLCDVGTVTGGNGAEWVADSSQHRGMVLLRQWMRKTAQMVLMHANSSQRLTLRCMIGANGSQYVKSNGAQRTLQHSYSCETCKETQRPARDGQRTLK